MAGGAPSVIRRVTRAVVWCVATVAIYLASVTIGNYDGGASEGVSTEFQGLATATSCTQVGPVSSNGYGYWWNCAVTVIRKKDVVEWTSYGSAFTPADIGEPRPVVPSPGRPSSTQIYERLDIPANEVLTLASLAVLVASAGAGIVAAVQVVRVFKPRQTPRRVDIPVQPQPTS